LTHVDLRFSYSVIQLLKKACKPI